MGYLLNELSELIDYDTKLILASYSSRRRIFMIKRMNAESPAASIIAVETTQQGGGVIRAMDNPSRSLYAR